jgi:nucleoside-diphosphate-sugar epimerase
MDVSASLTGAVAFVTGGSGLVGRALVSRLAEHGVRVVALTRSRVAAGRVEEAGAEPLAGDLQRPEEWADAARQADVVWHLGLPRLEPPVRGITARRLTARARSEAAALRQAIGDRPLIAASSAGVYGDRRDGPVGEGDPLRPLALARFAEAAERALAGPGLRVVRLPWVYGAGGLFPDVLRALRQGRFRKVGSGDNRWSLLSAEDAAVALVAAAAGEPGAYAAAEPAPPTQVEVIEALCSQDGLRRPDHLPPALAALTFGGPLAQALAASIALRSDRLAALGWRPADDWRRDLVTRSRPDPAAAAG